jgi:DNA-binding transcriptional LysR family regulator
MMPVMDLRQLRSFVLLAKELHFGRASARLFVTQPALSAAIRQLEEELGVKLFERNSKQVSLTNAGQTLLGSAASLVSQADRTLELGKALSHGLAGQIEVGFVERCCSAASVNWCSSSGNATPASSCGCGR